MDKVATVAKPWTDVCKLYMNKCLLYRTNLLHQQSHGQMTANYTWTKWLLIIHGQCCYIRRAMDRCLQTVHGLSGDLERRGIVFLMVWLIRYVCKLYLDKVAALIRTTDACLEIIHDQNCCITKAMDNFVAAFDCNI